MNLRKYFEKCPVFTKNHFIWWKPREKVLKNWILCTWSVRKYSNDVQKMAHTWNASTNCVLNTKTFFINYSGFGRAKWTLENISKNVSPHKKPFYIVKTTRKSFEKLDFMYLESYKILQWRQKMAHSWNASTDCVLNTKTFFINSTLDLGEQNEP